MFIETNFCNPLFVVFDDVKKIFKSNNRQARDLFFLNIFKSQDSKKEVLYHEIFRLLLYNIVVHCKEYEKYNDE